MSETKNAKKEEQKGMQQAKDANTAVIWLGPSIAGVATTGTVYRNGLTPQMQEAVREVPALNNLLVSVSRAVKVRSDLRNPQSAAGICYNKALEYAKTRGGKS
jgi:hypothetical protein